MRAGDEAGALLDALCARGQITVHGSEIERRDALAEQVAVARLAGLSGAVVVDTREHAATLNVAIRDRLVAAGAVRDQRAVVTREGQRFGAGDVIMTHRNDPTLGIANRWTWSVTRVHRDGRIMIGDAERGSRELTADYVRKHVELGTPPPATAPKAPGDRVGGHRSPGPVPGGDQLRRTGWRRRRSSARCRGVVSSSASGPLAGTVGRVSWRSMRAYWLYITQPRRVDWRAAR